MAKLQEIIESTSPSPEIRRQMAEVARKGGALSRWMSQYHEAIFKAAPNCEDWAVGVYPEKGRNPEVYYFREKLEALDFREEQENLGKTTEWRYRRQGDYNLML